MSMEGTQFCPKTQGVPKCYKTEKECINCWTKCREIFVFNILNVLINTKKTLNNANDAL